MIGKRSQIRLNEITTDNLSGSIALLSKVGALFQTFQAEQEEADSPARKSLNEVRAICSDLVTSQPTMAALIHLVDAVLRGLEDGKTPQEQLASALGAIPVFLEKVHRHQETIAEEFLAVVPNPCTVLTHSSSSQIREALLRLKRAGRDLKVIATESRPMLEGTHLAKALVGSGIPCSLTTDSLAVSLLKDVDCAVVGGDALLENGLVNKAGTLGLAMAAGEFGKPFWALLGTEKFLSERVSLPIPNRPAEEVFAERVPGLTVINRYFDFTPIKYLTGVVTELGPFSGENLQSEIERHKPLRALHLMGI
jgi:translation initiation factor 2B subunit (eIF-2B alpha/beta/delta family)